MAKIEDTPENLARCICEKCPTHDSCAKEKKELLFCARGESACPLIERGCICGDCPNWALYGLEKGYFCLHGKAI